MCFGFGLVMSVPGNNMEVNLFKYIFLADLIFLMDGPPRKKAAFNTRFIF